MNLIVDMAFIVKLSSYITSSVCVLLNQLLISITVNMGLSSIICQV